MSWYQNFVDRSLALCFIVVNLRIAKATFHHFSPYAKNADFMRFSALLLLAAYHRFLCLIASIRHKQDTAPSSPPPDFFGGQIAVLLLKTQRDSISAVSLSCPWNVPGYSTDFPAENPPESSGMKNGRYHLDRDTVRALVQRSPSS